ncbi:hypothetical protein MTR_7g444870 [Medicago truncatula]|uniref:Uncharacterized protein n=1 Tax=Medicago truncatula TaxID=3880 RepID=A0A072U964_MEDTR|nr:hypothetical protein MTR_7g444870 [Medicago truncatula]
MCSIQSGISTKIWKLAEDVASLANLWAALLVSLQNVSRNIDFDSKIVLPYKVELPTNHDLS